MTFVPDFAPSEELAEALDTFGQDAQQESFRITTEEQAVWAARKLARLHEQIREREEVAKAEVERITTWLADANAPLHASAEWFTSQLEGYHRDLLAQDAKRKTVKLPGVKLEARKKPDPWTFDPDTFLPWAKEHLPDAVRTKDPEVAVADAKKLLTVADDGTVLTKDGEVVPGVSVGEGDVGYAVKVE